MHSILSLDLQESRLYGHASKGLIHALRKRSITMNAHANGIPVDTFYNQTELVKSFRVISTNYDRNGTHFISTFEGKKLTSLTSILDDSRILLRLSSTQLQIF